MLRLPINHWIFILIDNDGSDFLSTKCISVYQFDRRVKEYQKEHREASSDISDYLSNPINAYLLTKRLTSDWRVIEDYMSYDVGGGKSITNETIFWACVVI